MPRLRPDSPRVAIVLPELALTFKAPPPGQVLRPAGELAEIRQWWERAAGAMRADLRGMGFRAEIVETPGWEITPAWVETLGADLAIVPHRTRRTWEPGATRILFWMQSWLPWLFTVDPAGWGAEHSGYPVDLPRLDSSAADGSAALRHLQETVRDRNLSKFPQPPIAGDGDPLPDKPFVFFPCQLPHDENVLQHSDVDEELLVREIAEWARASGIAVVFKAHPANPDSCLPLFEATKPHGELVRWVNRSVHQILAGCAAVFTINSGVGFEAMLHGVPVVAWGRAEYDRVTYIGETGPGAIAAAWAAASEPQNPAARYGAFLRYFLEHHALDFGTAPISRDRHHRLASLAGAALAAPQGATAPVAVEPAAAHANVRRVFIGFDPRQALSTVVAMGSAMLMSSRPLAITPLILGQLPIRNVGLTPFTFTRFLVPWLCGFEGWALFVDADVLFRCDVDEIFRLADPRFAVMVAALPAELAYEQAAVMLFNCGHPDSRTLTPEAVGARETTMIDWTDAVGRISPRYNHLIGYAPPRPEAAIAHFTQGIPVFPETQGCEFAAQWIGAMNLLTSPIVFGSGQIAGDAWEKLMGNSVHAVELPDGRRVPRLSLPRAIPAETPDHVHGPDCGHVEPKAGDPGAGS